MELEVFLCRSDNYGILLRDPATGQTASIDAPDAAAIERALARRGWRLDSILVTHRHADHIEGIPALVAKHGSAVIAPRLAAREVPGAVRYVGEGDIVEVGSLKAEVWETPGHCADHLSFHFPTEAAIFVGDVLFVMGCGRVFEATPEVLYQSCRRIAALPAHTKIYCGHEYTLSNAKFCAHIEPNNPHIAQRLAAIETLRAKGGLTVPTTLAEELQTNVFLRAGNAEEFTARREAKNRF